MTRSRNFLESLGSPFPSLNRMKVIANRALILKHCLFIENFKNYILLSISLSRNRFPNHKATLDKRGKVILVRLIFSKIHFDANQQSFYNLPCKSSKK